MQRRDFLKTVSWSLPVAFTDLSTADFVRAAETSQYRDRHADVLVVGGGLGGCAAALAAVRNGCRVVMIEPTDWIGGQLTSQAVPPDENAWIETHGCTASYASLRKHIRRYYRNHYPLTTSARNNPQLNPGNGMVSRLCHEPRVALAALYQLLAPYLSNGQLEILLNQHAVAAEVDGDRIRSVECRNQLDGQVITLSAPFVIDATETGDLLPLANAEYVTGFEAQSETNEPHAPADAEPSNMQAVTWCFPMQFVDGADHTINKPKDYDFWRSYVPQLEPAWSGRLLDWTYSHPVTLEPRTLVFDPAKEAAGWWTYRRIVDRSNFADGHYPGSITLVNWPQNDYLKGNFCEVSEAELQRHQRGAKQLSRSLLFWMQTEAPRPDGGVGWPGLRLMPGLTGTANGLAKAAYIRESRRIRAVTTVVEQHVSTEARMRITGHSRDEVRAVSYRDSVGIGHYRIDLHPSTGGDNYLDLASLPFEIPLGALIPVRLKNLLPGCKNLGVTHITNGCYRLHPVEWNVGEASGALVAYCLRSKQTPASIQADDQRLEEFQKTLQSQGVRLRWA